MSYTIKELADLVGISPRALRYYDQINLLKPAKTSTANYRLYETPQVQRLREIMTYRALNFSLEQIQQLLYKKPSQRQADLQQQLLKLRQEQNKLNSTIQAVQQQILINQGVSKMTDEEQFAIFKQQKITANETAFGKEIRQKYGETTIQQANQQYANLTAEKFTEMQTTETQLIELLQTALANHKTTAEQGQEIYQLHRRWLSFTWPKYSTAAHRGLAEMYLADQRFIDYYDQRAGSGATQILHDSIEQFAK